MANSRTKGKNGELEAIRELKSLLGDDYPMERNLVQTRDGGIDFQVGQYGVEVKRYAQINPCMLSVFWRQAYSQALDGHLTPALMYRQDRSQWRIRVPMPGAQAEWLEDDIWAMDLSVDGFCLLVREQQAW